MRNKMKFIIALLSIVSIAIFTIKIVDENKYKSQLRKEIREFVQAQEQSKILEAQKLGEAKALEEQKIAEAKALEAQKLAETQVQNAEFENQPYIQLQRKIQKQAEIDKMLLEELENNQYTLENPFIVVDPYGESPLTALVLFKTDEPMQISVHIKGDSKNDGINFDFEAYNTSHIIPIYGLYSERINTVILTAKNEKNNIENIEYEVEGGILAETKMPEQIHTKLFDENAYSPGLNLLYEEWACHAIDSSGEFRWALNVPHTIPLYYSKNERGFFYPVHTKIHGDSFVVEINPLGRILNLYHFYSDIHHDLVLTDNNTLLVTSSNPKTPNYVQDLIGEIDLVNGKTLRKLDYKNILDTGRDYGFYYKGSDWLHNNSIVPHGDNLIVSHNVQSLVMKHNWNGDISWMLSDPAEYGEDKKEYLLSPVGENFEYPYNQHAATILPDYDNNEATTDILLFDNGSSRVYVDEELKKQIRANKIVEPLLYSRMVHYRINEKEMTVEQLWQYGKENPEIFSTTRGDADLLPNGNLLGTFALTTIHAFKSSFSIPFDTNIEEEIKGNPTNERIKGSFILSEVSQDKNPVWQAQIFSTRSLPSGYRAERMNIYTPNANNLHLGEKTGIFLPEKFLLKD